MNRFFKGSAWAAVAAYSMLSPSPAEQVVPSPPVVIYSISTPDLANHKLSVEAEFPAEAFNQADRTLALPVWTPGSYKVRDYSKSISDVRLLQSPGARLEKTAKNRWTVKGDLPPGETIKVAYTVYGHELTVRTNFFSPDLSLIVGAATFLSPAPLEQGAKTVYQVKFPQLTQPISSGLQRDQAASYPMFVAENYDELVDSPLMFGDITEHPFQVDGVPHTLVQGGDRRYWNTEDSVRDTAKLVETVQRFWGQTPYKDYHFLNMIVEARGGLEHLDSSVLMTSRFATDDREKYVDWLSLVCHEHFHAWNVKRLRPKALGPFEYEQEVLTPSLWVSEGITSYYDDLLVRRAGLSTRQEYLKALSGQLNTLQNTPGRLQRPLTQASLDAWIGLYQPTDNSINDDVSYYNKGAVVAWLLDTEIRRQTSGAKNLDQVMREAYSQFSDQGFEEHQFRALVNRVSGLQLDDFFRRACDSTEELDFAPALAYWGLEWVSEDEKAAQEPYLGVKPSSADPRIIEAVLANGPAARAGLSPGDELVAIDEVRIPASGVAAVTKHFKPGQTIPVLFSRRGRVQQADITLQAQPAPKRALKIKKGSAAHTSRLEEWLGPETPVAQKKATN